MSLFSHLCFFSSDTLSRACRDTIYLMTGMSLLSVREIFTGEWSHIRCQRCEGATNSQIRRSGQNKLFCPLPASGMLSLTTARTLMPKPLLRAKTNLHYNSFSLLKMCPCTSYMGAHLTLSKTPFTPTGGSGKPCMGEKPTPCSLNM